MLAFQAVSKVYEPWVEKFYFFFDCDKQQNEVQLLFLFLFCWWSKEGVCQAELIQELVDEDCCFITWEIMRCKAPHVFFRVAMHHRNDQSCNRGLTLITGT